MKADVRQYFKTKKVLSQESFQAVISFPFLVRVVCRAAICQNVLINRLKNCNRPMNSRHLDFFGFCQFLMGCFLPVPILIPFAIFTNPK